MNDIRKYINILENASQDELQKYRDEVKYWSVSPELLAQYRDGTNTGKDLYNNLYWRNQNGQYHRDGDKPAWIGRGGRLVWYQNGENHRDDDKPAIIFADGGLSWFQNDQRHRFRGPARITPDGELQWYWRGEPIPVNSQEEFIEYLKKHKGLQRFRVNKP